MLCTRPEAEPHELDRIRQFPRQAAYLTGAAAVFACLLWFRFVVGRRVSRAIADCIDGRGGGVEAAAIAGHACSRYALRRLVRLARGGEAGAAAEGAQE